MFHGFLPSLPAFPPSCFLQGRPAPCPTGPNRNTRLKIKKRERPDGRSLILGDSDCINPKSSFLCVKTTALLANLASTVYQIPLA
jgi:hypothetical protein